MGMRVLGNWKQDIGSRYLLVIGCDGLLLVKTVMLILLKSLDLKKEY